MVIVFPEFMVRNFVKETNSCQLMWSEEWMGKAHSLIWFLAVALLPVLIMVVLYSRVVYTLWCKPADPDGDNSRQQV